MDQTQWPMTKVNRHTGEVENIFYHFQTMHRELSSRTQKYKGHYWYRPLIEGDFNRLERFRIEREVFLRSRHVRQ